MSRKNPENTPTLTPTYEGPPLAATVSFELTNDELGQLITACAEGGHFTLGCKLAEKKSNLRANVRRMEKDAALLQAAKNGS